MKPRTLRYRTFAEIAAEWARELDEARRPGRPNRDEIFLGLLNAVWGGQLNDAVLTIEQAPRDDVDGQIYKPAPLRFTREMLDKVVLVQQGARRRYPAASRWKFRTSLKLEDYDPGSLSAYVEPLTISKEDFRRWCDEQGHQRPRFWFGEQTDARAWGDQYDEENLPRVQFGTQHTPSAVPPAPTDPKPSTAPPNRRGRKPGSGSYDSTDMPLIKEMHRLIKSKKTTGRYPAMLEVVDKAKGTENTIHRGKRLLRKYTAEYGPDKDLSD